MLCVLTIDCGVPSKLSRRVGFRLSLSSQPNPTPFASSPPSPSSISSSLLLLLLDLSDLIGGLAIVCRAGAACALHLRQQAFHGSPVVELVLNRCLIVESSSHGQGDLNLLAGLGAEFAVAIHALSLATFCTAYPLFMTLTDTVWPPRDVMAVLWTLQVMLSAAAEVMAQSVSPTVTTFSQATPLKPDPEMVSSASAKPIILLAFPGAALLLTLMADISEVRQPAKVNSRSEASVAPC